MSTTLDPQFLVACMKMNAFKGGVMRVAQGALLHLALQGRTFTAADLPGEVTGGSKNVPGAATGALIAQGLLIVVDRVKSPRPEAKGRKLDVLRLAPGKYNTAVTWLARNELPVPKAGEQLAMGV